MFIHSCITYRRIEIPSSRLFLSTLKRNTVILLSILLGSLSFVLASIPRGGGNLSYDTVGCEVFSEEPPICHTVRGYGRPFVWVEVDRVSIGDERIERTGILEFLYGNPRGERVDLLVERVIWWAVVVDLAIYSSFFFLVLRSVIGYRTRKRG